MKQNEKEFLAQVGMGWFSVHCEDGTIWRMARSVGGSHSRAASYMKMIPAERAERSATKDHLKICFTVASRKRMQVYAHRIMWMVANHKDIPNGLEVNHKDGNPRNNLPSNLEVVTHQENADHAAKVLRRFGRKEQRATKNTSSKLTAEQVMVIRNLAASRSMTQGQIAELFQITQETVSNIHNRKTWGYLP